MSERFPLAYIFPLRILCGLILLLEGWSKLQGDWLHGTPLATSLGNWLAADKPYGFFVPMVRLAYAHPKIFGALVTIGEAAIGLSLLPGNARSVLFRMLSTCAGVSGVVRTACISATVPATCGAAIEVPAMHR